MEEYVGNEEEATPAIHIMVMQEEREETEKPSELRKKLSNRLRKVGRGREMPKMLKQSKRRKKMKKMN